MATITVRNLDDATDRTLHQAADASPPSPTGAAFLAQLRTRFAHRYAEDLELPPRDNPLREVDLGQP